MTRKLLVGMISLGCNKNRVDSETALGLLRDRGYGFTEDPARADILMVNTCGFIEAAKEESINTILEMAQYKETGRCRVLAVTGCLAQRYEQELLAGIPEIDVLLGVNQYRSLPDAIEKALKGQERQNCCQDDFSFFEQERMLTTPAYTAYTRIGDGCSNRCTFCAIPMIRGPYRSRDRGAILQEIRTLAERGVKEHILVAQDTTRYGMDRGGPSQLPELMTAAADVPGVAWLRVLYCYPDETREALLDAMASRDNICKYLDLPVQHIDDGILKRMHRRGDSRDIRRALRLARERGFVLRTTLIVGFPGETEDQFKALMDFVREAEFDRMGAFAYSPEEGTPAARLPDQVPEPVKQERLHRIMTLQREISLKRNRARIGTELTALITDRNAKGELLARSQYEAPETDGEIYLRPNPARMPEVGEFTRIRITDAGPYDLMGEIV